MALHTTRPRPHAGAHQPAHEAARLLPTLALALALVLPLLGATAPPAEAQTLADPTPPADRDDPVALALSWSALIPDGGVDTVLLGTTRSFADSLAAGGVQNTEDGGPLLLHDASTTLDPRVAEEIERLGADTVIILGGEAAITPQVADALRGRVDDVERISGAGRRETAIAIANRFFPDATEAIIVRADGDAEVPTRGFVDALGAGTLSKVIGAPILLNSTSRLDDVVRDHLTTSGIQEVQIVGGTGAISADAARAIDDAVPGFASRRGGATRNETAALVATQVSLASTDSIRHAVALVDGGADLAWASGLPATYHVDELLLSRGDDASAPTLRSMTGARVEPGLRCGPLTSPAACSEARAAESVGLGDLRAVRGAILDGRQEVPPSGLPASGEAAIYVGADFVCLQAVATRESGPLTGLHLHDAPRGANGPVVVPFEIDRYLGQLEDCVLDVDDAVIERLVAEPTATYLNMHTEARPDGELRGQLHEFALGPFALATGEGVVPAGSGADSGNAVARLRRGDADVLCYRISPAFGPDVVGVVIGEGAEGEAGEVVVSLPVDAGTSSTFYGCVEVPEAALDRLFETPSGFFVEIATEELPEGAQRGQFS